MKGACSGEKRVIRAPPEYAYGSSNVGTYIPANASLRYEFDIEEVNPNSKVPNHFEKSMHGRLEWKLDKLVLHKLVQILFFIHLYKSIFAFRFENGKTVDKDQDGFISEEELLNLFAPRNESNVVPGILSDQDRDKDGVISFDEFLGAKYVPKTAHAINQMTSLYEHIYPIMHIFYYACLLSRGFIKVNYDESNTVFNPATEDEYVSHSEEGQEAETASTSEHEKDEL